jgi:hypothetical protein
MPDRARTEPRAQAPRPSRPRRTVSSPRGRNRRWIPLPPPLLSLSPLMPWKETDAINGALKTLAASSSLPDDLSSPFSSIKPTSSSSLPPPYPSSPPSPSHSSRRSSHHRRRRSLPTPSPELRRQPEPPDAEPLLFSTQPNPPSSSPLNTNKLKVDDDPKEFYVFSKLLFDSVSEFYNYCVVI